MLTVIFLVIIYYCDGIIQKASKGKLYNNPGAIPYNKVCLLLGTVSSFLTELKIYISDIELMPLPNLLKVASRNT